MPVSNQCVCNTKELCRYHTVNYGKYPDATERYSKPNNRAKSNLNITVNTGQVIYMKFQDQVKASRYIVTAIPGRNLVVLANTSGGVFHTPKTVKSHYTHFLSVLLGEPSTKPIRYVRTETKDKFSYKVYKVDIGRKYPDPVTIYVRE